MTRLFFACVTLILAWASTPTRANALVCGIFGCSCNVSATTLDFQNINPLSGAQSAEGQVTVDCTGIVDLFPSMVVRMQSGTYGTINARKMRSPSGDLLDYNIYTTSQHSAIWGNGTTGSTVTVSGGLLALGHWSVSRQVYGVVSPTLSTKPGSYTDTVIVRIDW